MQIDVLLNRINFLLQIGKEVLDQSYSSSGHKYVPLEIYANFRSASLSFILNLYGRAHPYFQYFNEEVKADINKLYYATTGYSILKAIKVEIENGWLQSYKQLVTADIFSDFLEMGKHLLDQNYKDAAAVMIGSTLEEHLRQLCSTHGVETTFEKNGDLIPKKADLINSELVKAGAYGPLEQKSVTAWLGLRNSAAHGKYDEYVIDQVRLMYQGVLDFVTRVN